MPTVKNINGQYVEIKNVEWDISLNGKTPIRKKDRIEKCRKAKHKKGHNFDRK
jgi:hypothetical protein